MNTMHVTKLLFLSLWLLATACQTTRYDLLIVNARIVDVYAGEASPPAWVGIVGDTIRATGVGVPGRAVRGPRHDAQQQYLMPGLWDMHVHFRGGDSLVSENRDLLPLFLQYGVTTVRDAGGDITPHVLSWRTQIAQGTLAGPRIFTSGPKLDGSTPAWDGSLRIVDSADVAPAFDSLQALGVDYVKTYDGNLTAERYYDLVRMAERRGLRITGHMPLAADVLTAARLGLDGSEHMYYVLKACSPQAARLTQEGLGYGMVPTLIATYDSTLAAQTFAELSARAVYVTPTLHIGRVLAELADADHSGDTLLSQIGPGIHQTYNRRIEAARRAQATGNDTRQRMVTTSAAMIAPMYAAGMPLLAGSDCGPFNSYVYPGQSLHAELAELVAAGLTPLQALRTSLVHGPQFFGLEDYYARVAPGRVADLILLAENPLDDISHTHTLRAVWVRGQRTPYPVQSAP